MIASMTGYGVAEGKLAQNIIKVEIRSLNSRYFDFSSRLPLAVTPFEGDIKKCVHARLKRGKINLSIMVNNVAEATAMITLDEKKLLFYMKELKRFGKKHGIRGELELKDLFSFPDLFICEQKKTSETTLKRCILDTVGRAVRNLAAMRLKEGAHTVKDLRLRVRTMERAVLHIERQAKKEPLNVKKRLLERIKAIEGDVKLEPERLEEEVAYLADKADITEEIVRLKGHLKVFRSCLGRRGEVGKRLEFIAQEMNRETNTIGSKAQHMVISQNVIAIKLETEKIKEQIQNLE